MDSAEKQLLYCLAAYRLGKPLAETVPDFEKTDWEELKSLSAVHKLSPVVFETLRKHPAFLNGDAQKRNAWKRDTLFQAAAQAAGSERITELAAKIEQAGIPYALLKGLVCRDLYSRPELRTSGDEDLFILPEDRERCQNVLKENGCTLFMGDDAVTHWNDTVSGLHIELHASLFSTGRREEQELNRLFTREITHAAVFETTAGRIRTFSPTWHFLFLVCHALKHFLAGGVGVRTLCDIVSFAERYTEDIDKETVYRLLETVNGRIFLDQIFSFGELWLGFSPSASGWAYASVPDAAELLEDCLQAGVYGQSSMSRKHSAGLVLHAAENEGKRLPLLQVLFPKRKNLLNRYPVLNRFPVLLPLCWVHRIGTYGKEILSGEHRDNSPAESIALGRKRTEMMVKYGIFTKGKKKN